jgi:hypothetical protein
MYVSIAGALGDDTKTAPRTPTTLRMRPVPYLCLDRFPFDKSILTRRVSQMLDGLVAAVTKSWSTSQPITSVRLVGHTDSTGKETYNVGLGDRRAAAIEKALRDRLKGLASRVKITVQKSPGEMEPRRDNRTADGREVNRRVEVFVTVTPRATPTPPPGPPFKGQVTPPPEPIIRTQPDPIMGKPTPVPSPANGRSFENWLDEKLRWVPSWLRKPIRDAVIGGACTALAGLLDQTNLPGADKSEIKEACQKAAAVKAR